MSSADKVVRGAFESIIIRQHERQSTYECPSRLFELHEKTGLYVWPGLENRFKDFKDGCIWCVDSMKKRAVHE